MRGPGPRGKTRGDTEQWVFPDVKLEKCEIKLLVGTVVEIMTRALFSTHYYSFGGKMYHQRGWGPSAVITFTISTKIENGMR